MNTRYSFLNDELAVIEIRKHKWIESEKQGQEIGFATAAIDWIKKYGETWLQYRVSSPESKLAFSEKRQHRRFALQFPVWLSLEKDRFNCQTNDISLVGMSCTLPVSLPSDAPAEVLLVLKDTGKPQSRFEFTSRIARVSQPQGKNGYNVFLPFNEEVRDYLRANVELLSN